MITPEQHDQISTTIKLIAESMGVTYGRAKEACVAALVSLLQSPDELTTQISAFQDLKQAGPGAMCEECGHFASRHQEEAARKCWFPKPDGTSPCECSGFVWAGYRFAMDSRTGPLYIKEKV